MKINKLYRSVCLWLATCFVLMFTSFTFGAIRESDPRLNLFSQFTGHLNMNEDLPGNCRVIRQRAVTIPFDRPRKLEIAAQEDMGYQHSRNVNRHTLNETAYSNNYFTIMGAKIIFPGKLVIVLPLPLPLLLPELDFRGENEDRQKLDL